MKKVLFICTGNYYRSRLAEIYFNFLAEAAETNWRADSRGLIIGAANNIGEVSIFTRNYLRELGIELSADVRFPLQLVLEDLENADLIIALDEEEHLPMMRRLFPDYAEKIEYWLIHDVNLTAPQIALPAIANKVRELNARFVNRAEIL